MRKTFYLLFFTVLLLTFNSCSDDGNDPCSGINCLNGGALLASCECLCPEGYTGQFCEEQSCTVVCENNGTVTSDCTCDCPSGFVGELCEECIPKVGLTSTSSIDIWVSGSGSNYVNDVSIELPNQYLLTGIGFNEYTTLLLVGRELNNDGTLGERVEFRDGSDPTAPLDAFYEVPDGHVITGFGYGKHNLDGINYAYRIVVNYNEMIFDEECDLELGPEQFYDNEEPGSIWKWLKISDTSLDSREYLFGGLGINFRQQSYDAALQIEAEARSIINQF